MRHLTSTIVLTLGFACPASQAVAEKRTYIFEWQGGGGYSFAGALAFDTRHARDGYIIEADVDCFEFTGFLYGQTIGRWALGQKTEDTTWILTFDVAGSRFVVFSEQAFMPQAWNMDGFGEDCGEDGFGFNIGNAAQDLCLNGELVVASQTDPTRPLPATQVDAYAFASDACLGPELLSFNPARDPLRL